MGKRGGKRKGERGRIPGLKLRAWLLTGRDQLRGCRNSLLLFRLLRARRRFGSVEYSDHTVRDPSSVSLKVCEWLGGRDMGDSGDTC